MYTLVKYSYDMYYSIHFFLLILLLLITRFFYIHLFSNGRRHVKLPPGPKGWPVIGALHLLGDKPNQSLAAMAKKYGPLMHLRLGTTDMVVASNPAMARAFLKTLDGDFLDRPYTTAARITYDAHDMVFGEYGPKWKLMRKLTSLHILGAKALEHGATVRQEEVGALVRAIRDAATVNVPEILSCTLANIISRLVFSRRMIQAGDEGPASRFKDLVNEAVALSSQFNIGDFIPSIAWMNLQGLEGEMKKTHRKFDQMMDEMIQLHVNAAGDREGKPDFLDILMADGGDSGYPSPLGSNNIKGLLLDLFIAGTDTSSSTIEWALAELMSDPALLGRAREELDRVIGPDRRLCESDLTNLPYLRAICKEVFRKHPATPLIPRVAAKDCHVDGYDIPRGTRLTVNAWAIGRDPEAWEEPHKFMPERFLGDGKGAEIGYWGSNFELIPFGAGRRICAGMRLAAVIVEYILGTLVHAFEWKLPEAAGNAGDGGQTMNMEESFGLTVKKAVPLRAIATPRLSPSAYAT